MSFSFFDNLGYDDNFTDFYTKWWTVSLFLFDPQIIRVSCGLSLFKLCCVIYLQSQKVEPPKPKMDWPTFLLSTIWKWIGFMIAHVLCINITNSVAWSACSYILMMKSSNWPGVIHWLVLIKLMESLIMIWC